MTRLHQLFDGLADWLASLMPTLFARRIARQLAEQAATVPKPRRPRRKKLENSSLIIPPPRKRKAKAPPAPEAADRAAAAKQARKAAAEAARQLGAWGESQATEYLQRQLGWKILARNVRFGPRKELDIVARQSAPSVLVFVEVKTSRSEAFQRPYARVDAQKRLAQSRAALKYLRTLKAPVPHLRFDVIEVIGSPDLPSPPLLRHIENAFPLSFSSSPRP